MNALLRTIAENASADLRALIEEGESDILTAIHKMQSEAQAQETNPKFSLGFKIAVDFEKGTYDCDLSWTLKQMLSTSHKIEDPNQVPLPLAAAAKDLMAAVNKSGTTMTLETEGESVTITAEQAGEAVKRINKRLAKN